MDTKTKQCKYGVMTYPTEDFYIGQSMELYGEYCPDEAKLYEDFVKPGMVVLDIGANIGAYTVLLSKLVGEEGKVFAFEPNPEISKILSDNLLHNECWNTMEFASALGAKEGKCSMTLPTSIDGKWTHYAGMGVVVDDDRGMLPVITLDSLNLQKIDFIKIDAEGSEIAILKGAKETIERCRPLMYIENDKEQNVLDLINTVANMDYRMYWHTPAMYSPNNYEKNGENIFGATVNVNMLCIPAERPMHIHGKEIQPPNRYHLNHYEIELKRYEKFLKEHPTDPIAMSQYAYCLYYQDDPMGALKWCNKSLEINPDSPEVKSLKGCILLSMGDYEKGWELYEARTDHVQANLYGTINFKEPQWDGKKTGKRLLLWHEQGTGDTIQMLRFLPIVHALCDDITVLVKEDMISLVEFNFPYVKMVQTKTTKVDFDVQCSFMSLPYVLGITGYNIPQQPYLKAHPHMIDEVEKNLPRNIKIGMAWHANPANLRYDTISIPKEMIETLVAPLCGKYNIMALQQEMLYSRDWHCTAALISVLDLVICVDTGVGHLTGALGKPCWLLLSQDTDWRWGKEKSHSAWYPKHHLFRQKNVGDWSEVFRDIDWRLSKKITVVQEVPQWEQAVLHKLS